MTWRMEASEGLPLMFSFVHCFQSSRILFMSKWARTQRKAPGGRGEQQRSAIGRRGATTAMGCQGQLATFLPASSSPLPACSMPLIHPQLISAVCCCFPN